MEINNDINEIVYMKRDIKNNEKTNLIKSSAFIERDGIIYYIRLGYTLDYQQSGIPFGLKKEQLWKKI